MAELKPCPFCGGEAEIAYGNIYISRVVSVRCTKCRAKTNFVWIDHPNMSYTGGLDESTRYTEQQAENRAIEAWNRRAGDGK